MSCSTHSFVFSNKLTYNVGTFITEGKYGGEMRKQNIAPASLAKACQRKLRDTADACRLEGLVFLPFAMETLGGFHSGAVDQVKLLASALARSKGSDEGEATSQLFGRLSLNLMRGNAVMLSSRYQDEDIPLAEVDGIE